MIRAAILCTIILTGCATAPEPRIVIKEVSKPVPVSCVPETVEPAPVYPDSNEALMTATPDRRYQLVVAGRELRQARLNEIEPVIAGCRQ